MNTMMSLLKMPILSDIKHYLKRMGKLYFLQIRVKIRASHIKYFIKKIQMKNLRSRQSTLMLQKVVLIGLMQKMDNIWDLHQWMTIILVLLIHNIQLKLQLDIILFLKLLHQLENQVNWRILQKLVLVPIHIQTLLIQLQMRMDIIEKEYIIPLTGYLFLILIIHISMLQMYIGLLFGQIKILMLVALIWERCVLNQLHW